MLYGKTFVFARQLPASNSTRSNLGGAHTKTPKPSCKGYFILRDPTDLVLPQAGPSCVVSLAKLCFRSPTSRFELYSFKSRRCAYQNTQTLLQGFGCFGGDPNEIRTRVPTVKGWCPRPLDDGVIRTERIYIGKIYLGQDIFFIFFKKNLVLLRNPQNSCNFTHRNKFNSSGFYFRNPLF